MYCYVPYRSNCTFEVAPYIPSFERFSFDPCALYSALTKSPPIMYLARDSSLNSVQDATWWRSVIRREVAAERHDLSNPAKTSTPKPKQRPNSARTPHPSSGWLDNTPEWQAYLKTVTAAGKVAAASVVDREPRSEPCREPCTEPCNYARSHARSHALNGRPT